jgi:hypothetical protein
MRSPNIAARTAGRSATARERPIGAAAIAFSLWAVTENLLFSMTGALPYGGAQDGRSAATARCPGARISADPAVRAPSRPSSTKSPKVSNASIS